MCARIPGGEEIPIRSLQPGRIALIALLLALPIHAQERWTQTPHFVVYEPCPSPQGLPLVLCFSPAGQANVAAQQWLPMARKHKLLLAGSKQFRNGPDQTQEISKAYQAELKTAYRPDPGRSFCTGLSGGGQYSYAFMLTHPRDFAGVVTNTCYIRDDQKQLRWPSGKVAVLLASPGDFRYAQMKADHSFLKSLGWKVTWLEFDGGHTYAPASLLPSALIPFGFR